LLVLTSGVSTDPRLREELLSALVRHGMRLIGPNSVGLVNADPAVRLQTTFGAAGRPDHVGLAVQSGGVAVALTTALNRLSLGVSTAASTGDALDVNGDDLLAWWDADPRTTAAVLYLESLGRPRQFARLARRLAARKPVLTVRSGSSAAARRAAASHTAGSATPRVIRDALFDQAGVLAVDELAELPGLLALPSWQPLPRGRRVAVVSNAGGAGVLAADACARAGLEVNPLSEPTRTVLAALLPGAAAVTNPVDITATAPAWMCARVLERLLADADVDAVLAITVPTAAARRTEWLQSSDTPVPEPGGTRLADAHGVVDAALAAEPEGGWFTPSQIIALLSAAGLPLVDTTVVQSAAAAVRVWRTLGTPVALKADVEGVLHKSAAGAVRTGLASRAHIAAAVRGFRSRFGSHLRGILVQPMSATGLEILVGITADPLVGPMLTVGLGGTTTDLVDDRAHCLVPPTEDDLDQVLAHLRWGPRLLGRPDAASMCGSGSLRSGRSTSWCASCRPDDRRACRVPDRPESIPVRDLLHRRGRKRSRSGVNSSRCTRTR
jgi:acyl-CoA synthetase (NDP forming)